MSNFGLSPCFPYRKGLLFKFPKKVKNLPPPPQCTVLTDTTESVPIFFSMVQRSTCLFSSESPNLSFTLTVNNQDFPRFFLLFSILNCILSLLNLCHLLMYVENSLLACLYQGPDVRANRFRIPPGWLRISGRVPWLQLCTMATLVRINSITFRLPIGWQSNGCNRVQYIKLCCHFRFWAWLIQPNFCLTAHIPMFCGKIYHVGFSASSASVLHNKDEK
jgi:hypothetical protein